MHPPCYISTEQLFALIFLLITHINIIRKSEYGSLGREQTDFCLDHKKSLLIGETIKLLRWLSYYGAFQRTTAPVPGSTQTNTTTAHTARPSRASRPDDRDSRARVNQNFAAEYRERESTVRGWKMSRLFSNYC